jgi:TatA/E family protein of Tat protein translocase
MFGSIGMGEILVILVIVLLLFGSKELPQMARKVGKGYREFQKVTQNARDEMKKIIDEADTEEKPPFRG